MPLEEDTTGRFLPWIIGLMVFLATLALAAAMMLSELATRWDTGLSGILTVQVPPASDPNGPGTAERLETVLALLRAESQVATARVLDAAETRRLLEPWLGDAATLADLPVPALVDVTLRGDGAGVDLDDLRRRLDAVAPGTSVDSHAAWLGELRRLARTIELVALAVIVLVGSAAVAAVVLVTRAGLAIHAHVVELLHLMGAPDGYVARQFQIHVTGLAMQGALGGLALALATLFAVVLVAGDLQAPLLPTLRLSAGQWLVLVVIPLAAILLATVAARWAALRELARLP